MDPSPSSSTVNLKPKKSKASKGKRKQIPIESESVSTIIVPEQTLSTVFATPSLTESVRSDYTNIFGKPNHKNFQQNTTIDRKKSLMRKYGVTDKKLKEGINKQKPTESLFDTQSSSDSDSKAIRTTPEDSLFSIVAPASTKRTAIDSYNKVHEVELRDVHHPTYTPPLGSYDFYKVYDRYISLLEEFKKRGRSAQYEGLLHIWQQKIKSELINRFRWPPRIMSDSFWAYGYYRDYCPLEARVNLAISKKMRKSLEDMLFGHQSHHHTTHHSHRHRDNSGFNFNNMKTILESKVVKEEEADDDWFIAHPDIQKKVEHVEHKHHHHNPKIEPEKEKKKSIASVNKDPKRKSVSSFKGVHQWLNEEDNEGRAGRRHSSLYSLQSVDTVNASESVIETSADKGTSKKGMGKKKKPIKKSKSEKSIKKDTAENE